MDVDIIKLDPIDVSGIRIVDKSEEMFFENPDIYCEGEVSFTDEHPDLASANLTVDRVNYSSRGLDSPYSHVESLISVDEDVSIDVDSSEFLKVLLEHHSQDDRSFIERESSKTSRSENISRGKSSNLELLSGLLRINVVLEEKGYSSLPLTLSDIDTTTK